LDLNLSAELQTVRERARGIAETRLRPHAHDVDFNERFPVEGLQALVDAGYCGLTVPREYGGMQADASSACLIVEELARGCPSTAALLLTWAGGVMSIVHYGTAAQKDKWLPGVVRGEIKLSFALTEEHCGSDAAAIRSTAVRDGDGWRLNGKKVWIGNLGRADLTVVSVKTDPDAGSKGVSSFAVAKGTPGFDAGEIYSKLGARGTVHGEILLNNAYVPGDALLGSVGKGFSQMMHSLDMVRLLTAAHAIGIAQAAYDEAIEYAKTRTAFGQPLHKHQALAFMGADMQVDLHAARLVTLNAAQQLDAGQSIGTQAAMAKLVASEMATRVTHKAMQIFGAWGTKKGSVVEQMYREARITEIWDGSSEIQRLIIARGIFGR